MGRQDWFRPSWTKSFGLAALAFKRPSWPFDRTCVRSSSNSDVPKQKAQSANHCVVTRLGFLDGMK